ncbi:MAG: phosphate ABC transporter permease PstA [Actinomycetota bacterium]
MSATIPARSTQTGPDIQEALRGGTLSGGRKAKNHVASGLMVLAFLAAAIPLVVMGASVVSQGYRAVLSGSWWTQPIPETGRSDLANNQDLSDLGFGTPSDAGASSSSVVLGMAPAIVGTLLTVLGASALAIPLGIMGAVYLHEYGKNNWLAKFIRFMADVMTGVPSVVMGVFIYTIWVLPRGVDGKSAWAAALALACLMLPIVVRSTEEMLRLVPDNLREASAALGTRTWKTTVKVVLPAAIAGITSVSLLAVARAAGETAPVVFVIGFVTTVNASFSGANTTLSAQIYGQQQAGGVLAQELAWGAALTLVLIVLALMLIARRISRRFELS